MVMHIKSLFIMMMILTLGACVAQRPSPTAYQNSENNGVKHLVQLQLRFDQQFKLEQKQHAQLQNYIATFNEQKNAHLRVYVPEGDSHKKVVNALSDQLVAAHIKSENINITPVKTDYFGEVVLEYDATPSMAYLSQNGEMTSKMDEIAKTDIKPCHERKADTQKQYSAYWGCATHYNITKMLQDPQDMVRVKEMSNASSAKRIHILRQHENNDLALSQQASETQQ